MSSSPVKKPIPLLTRAFAKHYAQAVITNVENLSAHVRRICLRSPALRQRTIMPGQYIRVQINDPLSVYGILRPQETLRTYTICKHEPETGSIELRIHLYEGNGIGLNWARHVKAGDQVTFWGPQGDFVVKPANYHVFIGEETATIGFSPIITALGKATPCYGVLESDTVESQPSIPSAHSFRRVQRHGASPVASQVLLNALDQLKLPDAPGAAYIAGEARTCQLVRKHLMHERNWPLTAISVKPFWATGKRGLH